MVLSPFKQHSLDREGFRDTEVQDVYEGICGLISLFKKKMWMIPSAHAIRAYHILMSFLEHHYRHPHILLYAPQIRQKVNLLSFYH